MIKATTELRESIPKEPRGSYPGEIKYGFSFWKPFKRKDKEEGYKWITTRLIEEPVLIAISKFQLNSWGSEIYATKTKFVWLGNIWEAFKLEIPEGAIIEE